MSESSPYSLLFVRELNHGVSVALQASHYEGMLAGLSPEEQRVAASLGGNRRLEFAGGRLAMRLAFEALGLHSPGVLQTARGAPAMPAGLSGSITHKGTTFAALLKRVTKHEHVGIDLEFLEAKGLDVASRVCRNEEIESLRNTDEVTRKREVLVRFSVKEALYKALDPFVHRYVGFKEVAAFPMSDGRVRFELHLEKESEPFKAEGYFEWDGSRLLTTALVSRPLG